MGKQWKQCQTLCFEAPKSLQMVTAAMKLKDAYSLEGVMTNLDTLLSITNFAFLCFGVDLSVASIMYHFLFAILVQIFG